MQLVEAEPRRLRFGVFEADLSTGELSKRGRRLRLQEQPFRVLAMLLERPGELVTREQLRRSLWPHTTVDFDHGLNKAVSKIRDALGDSAESPRFVETVARRGYRFLAEVTLAPAQAQPGATEGLQAEAGEAAEPAPTPPDGSGGGDSPTKSIGPPVQRNRPLAWGVASLVAALALGVASIWTFEPHQPGDGALHSLAVLPLANFSNDPSQDYFADGMTDELITQLGKIQSLRVISRTSAMTFKNVHKPLPEIARELNVDAVVEGSVMRSGDQVRIEVQLIQAPGDNHIWMQSYAGDVHDTLTLQDRVAGDVAERIRANLDRPEQFALAARTVNPDAHENYLKGRYFWNKRTGDGLRTSIEYFNRAIDIDPSYADAYAGLADSYALAGDWEYGVLSPHEAFSKAKTAATRALILDTGLAEAHTSLAFALDLYGWEWETAEQEYRRAIALSPSYATAHLWYGWHLMLTGRNNDGILELREAERLDPLSLIISADLADALCIAHRFDESVEQSRKGLELDPGFALAHYELGQALEQKHLHAEAIAEFEKAIQISGHNGALDSNLAYAYAAAGRRGEARL